MASFGLLVRGLGQGQVSVQYPAEGGRLPTVAQLVEAQLESASNAVYTAALVEDGPVLVDWPLHEERLWRCE